MEELKLEEIVGYLPYGLKVLFTHTNKIGQISNIYSIGEDMTNDDIKLSINYTDGEHIWMFKPLLYPLSILTDEQKLNLLDGEMLSYISDIRLIRHGDVQWLLKNHFDIHNLIPRSLAIDKTTIKELT